MPPNKTIETEYFFVQQQSLQKDNYNYQMINYNDSFYDVLALVSFLSLIRNL